MDPRRADTEDIDREYEERVLRFDERRDFSREEVVTEDYD